MSIKVSTWTPSVLLDPFFIENGTQYEVLVEVYNRSEDENKPTLLIDDKSTTDSAKLTALPGAIEGTHAASKHQVYEANSSTASEYGKLYHRGTLAAKKDAGRAKRFAFPIAAGTLLRIKITKCHGEHPFIIRCVDSAWRFIKLEDDDFPDFPPKVAASLSHVNDRQKDVGLNIPELSNLNTFTPIGMVDSCAFPSLYKPELSRSDSTTPITAFRTASATELTSNSFPDTRRNHPRSLSLSCPPRTPGILFSNGFSPQSTPPERHKHVDRRSPGAPRFSPVVSPVHSSVERHAHDLLNTPGSFYQFGMSSTGSHGPITPSLYTRRFPVPNEARFSPPPPPLQGKFKSSFSVFGSPDRK